MSDILIVVIFLFLFFAFGIPAVMYASNLDKKCGTVWPNWLTFSILFVVAGFLVFVFVTSPPPDYSYEEEPEMITIGNNEVWTLER